LLNVKINLEGINPVPYTCAMFHTKTKNKMKNQNVKLAAHGAEIQVTQGGAVYVTINGTTVYFENGSAGRILKAWNASDMEHFEFPEFYQDPCEDNFVQIL